MTTNKDNDVTETTTEAQEYSVGICRQCGHTDYTGNDTSICIECE